MTDKTKPKKPNFKGLETVHQGGCYIRDPKTGKINPVDRLENDTKPKAKPTVAPVTKEK